MLKRPLSVYRAICVLAAAIVLAVRVGPIELTQRLPQHELHAISQWAGCSSRAVPLPWHTCRGQAASGLDTLKSSIRLERWELRNGTLSGIWYLQSPWTSQTSTLKSGQCAEQCCCTPPPGKHVRGHREGETDRSTEVCAHREWSQLGWCELGF